MGFCNVLLALLSPRLYGYWHRPRKRLDPLHLIRIAVANDLTPILLVFGWFQNMTSIAGLMTWLGICVVRVHSNDPQFLKASLITGFHDTDLYPIPSWLERTRPRPQPPPVQSLPPTLRGMVRNHCDHSDPYLQWILCIPPGKLGYGGLRHELHPLDVRSDLVRRRQFRVEEQVC